MAFYLYVFNAVINVGLDLLLIPRYGLWGAVVPVSLVILGSPIINAWVLDRMGYRVRPPWGFLGRVYLAALPMLLLWPLRSVLTGPEGFVGIVILGAIIFTVGLRVFRVFGPVERDLMERASPAAWSRLQPILAPSRGVK